MATVHKIEIGSSIDGRGVSVFRQTGETIEVDGRPMVRLSHGTIVRADGWHATKADARAAAADRIAGLGRTLLAQSEQLRQEATS